VHLGYYQCFSPSDAQFAKLGSSSWIPYAPQGVKETDYDNDDDDAQLNNLKNNIKFH
jgi:hypothetical protein